MKAGTKLKDGNLYLGKSWDRFNHHVICKPEPEPVPMFFYEKEDYVKQTRINYIQKSFWKWKWWVPKKGFHWRIAIKDELKEALLNITGNFLKASRSFWDDSVVYGTDAFRYWRCSNDDVRNELVNVFREKACIWLVRTVTEKELEGLINREVLVGDYEGQ